jgi:hypothetical protein
MIFDAGEQAIPEPDDRADVRARYDAVVATAASAAATPPRAAAKRLAWSFVTR